MKRRKDPQAEKFKEAMPRKGKQKLKNIPK
jgi:hypothetical protein